MVNNLDDLEVVNTTTTTDSKDWGLIELKPESIQNSKLFPDQVRKNPAEFMAVLQTAKQQQKTLAETLLAINTHLNTGRSMLHCINGITTLYGKPKFNSNFIKTTIELSGKFKNFKIEIGKVNKNDPEKIDIYEPEILPVTSTARARCVWDGGKSHWTPEVQQLVKNAKNKVIWEQQTLLQLTYKAINSFVHENAEANEMFGGTYTEEDDEQLEGIKEQSVKPVKVVKQLVKQQEAVVVEDIL